MKITRSLVLASVTTTLVSVGAVILVSAVPDVAPGLALLGILGGGGVLAAVLGFNRGATPALITAAMFLSLLPLLAIAGGQAFLLWTAAWAVIGVASKKISMQSVVERVTGVSRSMA